MTMNRPLVLVHSTSTTLGLLALQVDHILTIGAMHGHTWLRVMNPMMSSPGTGMQQRASLIHTSPTPDDTPVELLEVLRSTA
ncbi:MAG: hypothetical protein ACLR20_08765 [Bifidobacterium longum]